MDLRILLLISNFAMIYIIHKISVLIKNSMNYFKNKCFFKKYNRLLFKKKKVFSIHNDEKSKTGRRKSNQRHKKSF